MSTFRLSIETDNAAFEPSQGQEVARILRKLAVQVEDCRNVEMADGQKLMDYNGNSVGDVTVGDGAGALERALAAMPTISSGHSANLKIETDTVRVWLSRCTLADGETQPVSIEQLRQGDWVDVTELEEGEA